jgi:hypothetical protein
MKTNDYVTCKMLGRLGNNMFMIANCISQSIKHNREYVIYSNQIFDLNNYGTNIYRNINIQNGELPNHKIVNAPYNYVEVRPYDNEPTIFDGYYQSEKNFKEHSDLIKSLFGPTKEFVDEMYLEFPELIDKNVTCINVRRGEDYLVNSITHPVITTEYVDESIKHISNTDFYFILSDDLDWCRQNIKLPNSKFIEYSTWKALWLISLCKNFIISNSSFSWWGAYLSVHKDKIVVAPETWCGPGGPQNTQDVFCDGWVVLSTYYKDGTILPK